MKPVSLVPAPSDPAGQLQWCVDAIRQIARNSQIYDPNVVADGFTLTNVTASRSLDGASATLAQVRQALCTLLTDLKNRGAKRAY